METSSRASRSESLLLEMGWVHGLARSLVRDPNLADDVAQDAWLRAFERPPRHTRSGPVLRAWLARVTRTLARQSMRSEARRAAREHTAARNESEASTAEILARASMHKRLVEAVMGLDEPYRSSILYRYLDGMSVEEIARRGGASCAAVRQRLSRGLAELRSRLDREFGGDRSTWSALLVPLSSVPIAGASIMAKTATSVSVLQILGALTVCAGITFVISRSVGTHSVAARPAPAPLIENEAPPPDAPPRASTQQEPRTAATAAPEAATAAPAMGAVPLREIPDRPASQLDSLAETFLTEQPDLLGLMGALRTMVRDASVLADTVKQNEDDGAMEGEILVPGLGGKATFKITGKQYRIEFEPARAAELPSFGRKLALRFKDDSGRVDSATISVEYYPRSESAYKDLSENEERVVGWSVDVMPQGIHANPSTMRRLADGKLLFTGRSPKVLPRDENGSPDLATMDAWLRLLQGYAK